MSPIDYRAVILILAVLAGFGTICLGYRLFRLGIVEAQRASASYGNAKLSLASVGPGTFFALLGAGIIIAAVWSPASRSVSGKRASRVEAVQPVAAEDPADDAVASADVSPAITDDSEYNTTEQLSAESEPPQ